MHPAGDSLTVANQSDYENGFVTNDNTIEVHVTAIMLFERLN